MAVNVARRRRTGAETKIAILAAAADSFRDSGFERSRLEDIADRVGISRAAVLHHFDTKTAVLIDLVRPFIGELDELLDDAQANAPMSRRQRKTFIGAFVALLCEHRVVSALLIRDITAQNQLGPNYQMADRTARFIDVVTTTDKAGSSIQALAALGAILRPINSPHNLIDLDDPANRQFLVECAMAVFRLPPPSST